MASFTGLLTVEDSSPLISYAPAGSWSDSPSNDPLLSSYLGNSYHTSSAQGATATFSFVGTGVSIFGGRRPNYGAYTVSVDGNTIQTGTSQASQDLSRQQLASATGLSYGNHTLVLTNTGGAPVDIDSIDFQTSGGPSGSIPVAKDFDDADPAMTYTPSPDAWQTNTDPGFFGNTLHFTQTPGASASMKFSGEAVAVYGTVSPDHANIVVNVDGQATTLPGGANGFASLVHTDVLLFYRGDLDGTEHTITMSADSQPGTGPFIDLDRMTVFTPSGSPGGVASVSSSAPASSSAAFSSILPTASVVASVSASASASTTASAAADITAGPSASPSVNLNSNGSTSHTSTGVIVGSVIGGLAVLFMLLATAFLFYLRRRRQRTARLHKSMISVSPVLPMQEKPMTPILPMQRAPFDIEKGDLGRLENPAFPFPAQKKGLSALRYPAPSTLSDTASYHSRGPSELSNGSTAPLVQNVPVINAPQPRANVARKPPPGRSGSIATRPVRPTNRPPTMDFSQVPR
ncbi:hypothetical protein D9619_001541 [Psilocybe cf. subviscida]|uniref:Transmembrane protein n=1 Tax=Psilocybe cf. subviscida TaxID=2480587 RepID=A0A8H5F3M3_9AGAR|nr:hypothetical protein D9619_001541 [Psilocybe cf. subviscida]